MVDPGFPVHQESDLTPESITVLVASKESIPLLNSFPTFAGLKDGIVVRFRCMIQDSLDKVLKHKRCGDIDLRYRKGVEEATGESFSTELYDVDRYTAVSVPGEVEYPKISFDEVVGFYSGSQTIENPPASSISEEYTTSTTEPPELIPLGADESRQQDAQERVSPHTIPDNLLETSLRRVSAILNVCDPKTEFKLHDVVEVLGVLYKAEEGDMSLPKVDFSIDVISIEYLKEEDSIENLSETQIISARSAFKSVLENLLCGDELAAEYLILQLISARVGNIPGLGSWGLNLSNAQKVDVSLLSKFIRSVTNDAFISVPCSNEILSTQRVYPLRSSDSDFTLPGLFHLSHGSTVILDERLLQEGNVNALNILAINKAVREQKLMGVFGSSHVIDFDLHARFIILNSGPNKSIFGNANPTNGVPGSVPFINLLIRDNSPEFNESTLSEPDLILVRKYILFARRLLANVTITEEVINEFQNDWVESRKKDPAIPTEDIEAWATLLRALPASVGEKESTVSRWKAVLGLEAQRRQRNVTKEGFNAPEKASKISVTGA